MECVEIFISSSFSSPPPHTLLLLLGRSGNDDRAGQVRRLLELDAVLAQGLGDVLHCQDGASTAGCEGPGGYRGRGCRRSCASSSCSFSSLVRRRRRGGRSGRSSSGGRGGCASGPSCRSRSPPSLDLQSVGGDAGGEALRRDRDDADSEIFMFFLESKRERARVWEAAR